VWEPENGSRTREEGIDDNPDRDWLANFAYHIDPGVWSFVLAGSSALLVAALAVGYQAVKAATANPVESLRHT
jgi:hypothetical protein